MNPDEYYVFKPTLMQGHAPIVANDHAASLHQAIHGAADKLKRALVSAVGRLSTGAKGGERIADGLTAATDEPET